LKSNGPLPGNDLSSSRNLVTEQPLIKEDFESPISKHRRIKSEATSVISKLGSENSDTKVTKPEQEEDINDAALEGTLKKESSLMIRYNHPYKIKWDLIVMLLATYNTIVIPIDVSFEPEVLDLNFFFWLDSIIDFLFLVDILINFRYAYMHPKTGEEIRDPYRVAWFYLKTRFFIDFLATIPFDTIATIIPFIDTDSIVFQLFGILKLVRVLRLARIISFLNTSEDVKTSLKLGKAVFFLSIYLHCLACLWFFVVRINENWIPPSDFTAGKTDIYGETWYHQYALALYHSCLTFTGIDIGPETNFQTFFLTVVIVAGEMINALIFAEMAVILSGANREHTMY
jgi:hypothetical protein